MISIDLDQGYDNGGDYGQDDSNIPANDQQPGNQGENISSYLFETGGLKPVLVYV